MEQQKLSNEIQKYLKEDENILWTGKPNSKVIFFEYFKGILLASIFIIAELFTIISGLVFFINNNYISLTYIFVLIVMPIVAFFILYVTIFEKNHFGKILFIL